MAKKKSRAAASAPPSGSSARYRGTRPPEADDDAALAALFDARDRAVERMAASSAENIKRQQAFQQYNDEQQEIADQARREAEEE
jgi:hypothetical protein